MIAILKLQAWIIKNNLTKIKEEPRLKVFLIFSFIISFWVVSLVLFYKGFSFFNNFPLVGPTLVDESIYLFFGALFIMLIISSTIVCYVTFYTSSEVDFLFSRPVDDLVIYFYRLLQSILFSSWAFLFLGVPFLIAYALIKHVSIWFYLSIPFYLIPFLILPTALAALIILTFMRLVSYQRVKYILFGIAIIAIGFGYWIYRTNIRPTIMAKTEIDYIMNDLLHHLRICRHPFFPSYWISKSIVSSSIGEISKGLFYFFVLVITTLFSLQINWLMAEQTFYSGWVSSRGGGKEKTYPTDNGLVNYCNSLPHLLARSTMALIYKDIKTFLRDPAQWSQFLIYFGILGIYIFNLRNIPMDLTTPYWKILVTFLNLTAILLILASLTVRFLFPLISLEGNKIWVLGLAPITFRHLLFQKVILNFIGIIIISETLMFSTTIMLSTGRFLTFIFCGVTGLACFGLVGLSIGLGAIYPNFKEDNPARIVSGFGGTLNFIISLVYVAIIIVSFALPFLNYYAHQKISAHAFHILINLGWVITIIATALVGLLPLVIGYRHLEKGE
ncbi:MAG: hypothetical protein V1872_01330 [bacterium]